MSREPGGDAKCWSLLFAWICSFAEMINRNNLLARGYGVLMIHMVVCRPMSDVKHAYEAISSREVLQF